MVELSDSNQWKPYLKLWVAIYRRPVVLDPDLKLSCFRPNYSSSGWWQPDLKLWVAIDRKLLMSTCTQVDLKLWVVSDRTTQVRGDDNRFKTLRCCWSWASHVCMETTRFKTLSFFWPNYSGSWWWQPYLKLRVVVDHRLFMSAWRQPNLKLWVY